MARILHLYHNMSRRETLDTLVILLLLYSAVPFGDHSKPCGSQWRSSAHEAT